MNQAVVQLVCLIIIENVALFACSFMCWIAFSNDAHKIGPTRYIGQPIKWAFRWRANSDPLLDLILNLESSLGINCVTPWKSLSSASA